MRLRHWLGVCWFLSACQAPHAATQSAAPKTASDAPAAVKASSPPPVDSVRELPELVNEFAAEGVTGTIALFDSENGSQGCSDLERCRRAYIPASTFKIASSMLALEQGLVDGPDTILKWDGQAYSVEAWNQDLALRDAFRVSCVPCYRAIARELGEQVMREGLVELDYGNRDISGGVDGFWLWGGLRITPLEQIDFLRRFDGDELPISARTADIVRDIMTLDVTDKYVLRGKTGLARKPHEADDVGWFVGWLELGERRVFFATVVDGFRADVDRASVRRRVTERVLRARGLL
jgi:beta-lactamase class D